MKTILNIFKEITAIPRCSGTHNPFISYMQNLSKELNYLCLVDESNNILCKRENSKAKLASFLNKKMGVSPPANNSEPQPIVKKPSMKRRSSV